MPTNQYGIIKEKVNPSLLASEKIKQGGAFCLVRVPGSEIEIFDSFSKEPQEGKRQVICKPWNANSKPVYFFNGSNQNSEQKSSLAPSETSFADYRRAFELSMSELHSKKLEKVVLSRVLREKPPKFTDVVSIFKRATTAYPDAFVYLVSHPEEGIWLGASPEILLKQRQSRYESVSLAGTQPLRKGRYSWAEKEKAEQVYVSDYIRAILSKLNCKIEAELGPETVEAGNVAHLKTRFLFTSKERISTLLDRLHPTPAIAGVPKKEALELIEKTEKHDRGLYTGYIGVYDSEKADIYVNLRCMKLVSGNYYLYLGGGITIDSQLEKEWRETEYKAQTLLNLLNEE